MWYFGSYIWERQNLANILKIELLKKSMLESGTRLLLDSVIKGEIFVQRSSGTVW